jgi:hypothetical protein
MRLPPYMSAIGKKKPNFFNGAEAPSIILN